MLLLGLSAAQAQPDSTDRAAPVINISGLIDVFYSYDFNKPAGVYRQPFFYSYNRHNEFNLNFGYIRLSVEQVRYRANLALQTGTYVADNYADEPDVLKNIFEANAGLALNRSGTLWIDAGIFASHIGFESAIATDNWTLTRSMLADNSPYYLTGARLSYTPNKNWRVLALVCNGWQRIKRLEGNSLLSFGTQVQFTPNTHTTFNWSTFIGTDDPDSTRRMRYFNNFYAQFKLTGKTRIISGFDIGVQQKSINSSSYNTWYSPVFILQQVLKEKWIAALRAEFYQDKFSVIIPAETSNGFRTTGLSINVDYMPVSNVQCRWEGRWLKSKDDQFIKENQFISSDFFITTSIAVKLGK